MSSETTNPNTSVVSDSTNTSDFLPPHGLSQEAALRAIHERNQKVESENAFLQ